MPKVPEAAKPKAKPAAKKPTAVPPSATDEREVLYPEPYTVHHREGGDEPPITVALAKHLLGWETEDDAGEQFGGNYHVLDRHGKKVRLKNSFANRPFASGNCERLIQIVLRRRWRFNMEPIIVGRTGQLMNGQHSLVALVLADQEREKNATDLKWAAMYPGWEGVEVTLDKIINYGVEEDDEIANTLDTAKPRSLTDVLYRSHYFAHEAVLKERAAIAKVCSTAIQYLWFRTGAGKGGLKQSHGECLEFLQRHQRLIEAATHCWKEDGSGRISKVIDPGRAAAVMYLMAVCDNDRADGYADQPDESALSFEYWGKAEDFWTLLMTNPAFQLVRDALKALLPEDGTRTGRASVDEVVGVLAKAWNRFAVGEKFKPESLKLSYRVEDGVRILNQPPGLGGIDRGWDGGRAEDATAAKEDAKDREFDPPAPPDTEFDGHDADDEYEPTPDEVAAAKAEIDEEIKAKGLKKAPKPKAKPKK